MCVCGGGLLRHSWLSWWWADGVDCQSPVCDHVVVAVAVAVAVAEAVMAAVAVVVAAAQRRW